ncbi:MAG: putative porin, partial [Omnitrophica WOR_2 bacterium]
MRYFLIFFLLVISFIRVTGQETEKKTTYVPSPDTASIFYTQINDRWPGEKLTRLNDSILTGFQYFLPTEHETSLNALTGNAGLAYHSMVFDATPEYSGFRYTPFDYIDYKWINHKIRYFQTTGPYSNLFYSTGPGKEQLFNVTHSQNIAGGLTLGIDVMIVNSLGLYERQKSDNVSFAGTAQFISKKENYVVLGNYHNSRFRWRENGGVSKLSLFTNNVETDRSRIPIYLKNADNLQKESGFQIRQFYYFGKLKDNPVTDSLISDTIGPKKLHRYYDPYRSNFIRHTISYSQNADSYKDPSPNSGYYDRILIDSTKTMDSLYYQELLNDVSFEAGVG